ncbi:MAG: DUF2336 domain-containing protein [Maricaulaceae bacterium]
MLQPTALTLDEAMPTEQNVVPLSVRARLAKRLADVICIPASQITPQERHMAGDVLVDLLRDAEIEIREGVARRLTMLNEAPRNILVMLAKDDIRVARHVLENAKSLTDSDLIEISKTTFSKHHELIARRRSVADGVVEVLVQFMDETVVERLLMNKGASFPEKAIQRIMAASRHNTRFVELLVKRVELRPAHGLTIFWWSDSATRRKILKRFAVTRSILQDSCGDLFKAAAGEGWGDPATRKALQFIERRQRNRAAISRSDFESLEASIDHAAASGLTRQITQELAYMAGVKPATGAQILTDKLGEALAVFCKAPGLKREYLEKLWVSLRRPLKDENDNYTADFQRVLATYDSVSTDKAQTVLRYWNWSLTSALNEDVIQHIKKGVVPQGSKYSDAAITAALVFGNKKHEK